MSRETPKQDNFFSTSTRFLTFNPIFRPNSFFAFGPFLRVMALGTVTVGSASKFHAERSGREIQGSHGDPFRAIFAFNFDRQFLANIFVLLTPINQGYPPTHGQHSTLLWLKNSSLWWSTTSWLCGISHTNRPPGVGDHFCCP